MARRLLAFVCTCALSLAVPLSIVRAGDERDAAVAAALAVQVAMQQAREHLLQNQPKPAVDVLEAQLAKVNGNPTFLALLRDAYRQYVKDLRLAKQDAQADVYQQRLQILDPKTMGAGSSIRNAVAAVLPGFSKAATPATPVAASNPSPRPAVTARGSRPEEKDVDPFSDSNADRSRRGPELLAKAEKEFGERRFREAGSLFDQAHQAGSSFSSASKERWAYCKLHRVVEQLNQPGDGQRWSDVEREVRFALELAPRLEYGNQLLGEVQKRRQSGSEASVEVVVRHQERDAQGWQLAETTNFRIYHTQSRDLAEQVARIAEQTRSQMARKWFGAVGEDWNPKCDVYLHATGPDYARETGVGAASPGHSTIRTESGRVTGRRIHLHADEPTLLAAVLPHEATHVVLAGQFGDKPLPRWADEGMAVLSEPRTKIDSHLRNLGRCKQDGQSFHVRQLLQLNDYPEPGMITAFYASSVSLVEFLCTERDPQVFANFLKDAQKHGYEPALEHHYKLRGFDELQQRWTQKALADRSPAPGNVAQGKP